MSAGTIDVHAHYLPAWAQPMPAELFDLGAQLEAMDRLGMGLRVVCPPPFALGYAGEPDGRVNDAVADAVARAGSRFLGLGTVPLHRPAAAAAELRRCMEGLGLRGATIGSDPGAGRELDAADLEPFWEAAEELRAVLLLHPSDVPGGARMGSYHLRNLVGNPMATAHAAARLIFGGVLDRHPGLRIVLSHGGGALPWIAGRLDHGYQVRPECASACAEPPSAYLGRFWYDTVVFEGQALRYLKEMVGEGRVLFGTDTPFDMGDTMGLAEADHEAAARLLGLG
jgi:aminocarboxymuconate-semialdehyde decarboxylase